MYRQTWAILSIWGLLYVAHLVSGQDEPVFSCKPNNNFERVVSRLIHEKMQDYDDMAKKVQELKQYAASDQEEVRLLNRELERVKERLQTLEQRTGLYLTDCPTSGQSGVYTVFGIAYPQGLRVYCDTETDGGGWTVFQLRKYGLLSFDKEWEDYLDGFGSLTEEFWFGLRQLRKILNSGQYELRIDLEDWAGNKAHAVYSDFKLSGEDSNFAITVSGYKGTAGDSLGFHSGAAFSTKDSDNDDNAKGNCAKDLKGGWWFKNCNLSHLNGKYYKGGFYSPKDNASPIDGVSWHAWKNTKLYSMKTTAMKMRRK